MKGCSVRHAGIWTTSWTAARRATCWATSWQLAAHHKLVKRVAKTAATVVPLFEAPSEVLWLLAKVALTDHEGHGEASNLSVTRSNGMKIAGAALAVW